MATTASRSHRPKPPPPPLGPKNPFFPGHLPPGTISFRVKEPTARAIGRAVEIVHCGEVSPGDVVLRLKHVSQHARRAVHSGPAGRPGPRLSAHARVGREDGEEEVRCAPAGLAHEDGPRGPAQRVRGPVAGGARQVVLDHL